MKKAKANEEPIGIAKCQVQRSKIGEKKDLEIVATSSSKLMPSPKKFKLTPEDRDPSSSLTSLDEVQMLAAEQIIHVCAKVVDCKPETTVTTKAGKSLRKQEVVIGDGTSACRLVLWERNVDRLQLDNSYKLTDVRVKFFDIKYLALTPESEVIEVEDLGDVITEITDTTNPNEKPNSKVVKGEIVTLEKYDEFPACRLCRSKMIELSHLIAECTKCKSKCKLTNCNTSAMAKVVIQDTVGYEHRVTMFTLADPGGFLGFHGPLSRV